MAYDAKAIANYFLDLASTKNISLTPMQLQKLVFFAHGWHLALYKDPLIADPIQAWQFGPVVPSLYHEFKHAGSGAISSKATEFDFANGKVVEPTLPAHDAQVPHLLNQIWSSYGHLSGVQLSNLTHLADTPWSAVRQRTKGAMKAVITDQEIQAYFEGQLAKNKANAA